MKLPSIKPCPFCGSPARLDTQRSRVRGVSAEIIEHQVECENTDCWASIGPKDNARDAIEVWNRRIEK